MNEKDRYLNDLRRKLKRRGINLAKSMGQNFLCDPEVPRGVVANSGIEPGVTVLEVGPGLGALTLPLAEKADKLVAVELDKRMIEPLTEELADFDNVTLINADIMKTDVAALVQAPAVVCANLPYYITSPVLTKLINTGIFKKLTVLVQLEVGERMCAAPGDPDYGAFTVFINWHATPEICFEVPPESFYPPPKVTSAVVTLTPKAPPVDDLTEEQVFKIVKAAFAQRRKTLLNSLLTLFKMPKEELRAKIESCGIDPDCRGETLGVLQFCDLARVLL